MSMICKEAEISPGHLCHYFPGKEAIIEQMADEYLTKPHNYLGAAGDARCRNRASF